MEVLQVSPKKFHPQNMVTVRIVLDCLRLQKLQRYELCKWDYYRIANYHNCTDAIQCV